MKNIKKIIDISILGAYIALMYTTLPMVPDIYTKLRRSIGPSFKSLIDIAITILPFILFAAVYRKIKYRRFAVYMALALVFSLYMFLVMYLSPSPIEKIHFLEYTIMGYLVLNVFNRARPRIVKYLSIITTLIIVSYCDELIQRYLPNRVYDLRDVAMNVASGLLGLGLVMILRYGFGAALRDSKRPFIDIYKD